jgi:hypothetical protein
MGRRNRWCVRVGAIVLAITLLPSSWSFSFKTHIRPAITPRHVSIRDDVDLDVGESTKEGMTTLRFEASAHFSTAPAPASDGLANFFFRDEHRNMLLAGSGPNLVEHVKPTTTLMKQWEVEANKYRAAKPNQGDAIVRVTTTGIHFPGLVLKTMAYVGCKKSLVVGDPEYQFTLIRDELHVEGAAPLVWIFNQLTGVADEQSNPSGAGRRRTHSMNKITAKTTSHGVVFSSNTRITIEFAFPTILMRIMPVDKRMAERQGSESISRVIERDVGPSLNRLRKIYIQRFAP